MYITNSHICMIISPITTVVKNIMAMPYYKNAASASGITFSAHELAITDKLCEHGYSSWNPFINMNTESKCKFRRDTQMRDWIAHPELSTVMPVGTFMEQPFGTNCAPDFYIKVSPTFVLPMEAKSVTNGYYPVWNGGGPKPGFLYVFCSKKVNKTTIFMGDSVINLEQQRLIDDHILRHRNDDEELNNKLSELDENHRGISYYTRPMYQHKGDSSYTNYFEHERRIETEEFVVNWLQDKE
jgi:hypothetical protein